jgi:large subunit ribosomal protein L29
VKSTEIRERSDAELSSLESELERKLWKARFDNHRNQLDKSSDICTLRRDIARVKTILGERQRTATAKGQG